MSVEAIRSDWAGRVVDGRFPLLQWLGGSERCAVFLTEQTGPQARKAVIKLVPANDEAAEAYMSGWAATRTLSHPHLMRLFHAGRCEMDGVALIFVVNEYADEVLSEILPERALTPTEAREILVAAVDVLSYLHGKGLVHGHLKPSNVMDVDDRLMLSGDSLQAAGERLKLTSERSIHDAPETAAGPISPAADLWGLGVTLVEALTQHPPVWNPSVAEDPVIPKSIPQPFAGIARGCLRADPIGRCTLDNVKTWLETGQPESEPAETTGKKARAKNRGPVVVAAAIVLVSVFAMVETRSHRTNPSLQAATEAPQQIPPSDRDQAEAKPSPAEPQAAPATQASKGPVANGAVAEQVMPDVLPKALASIHGRLSVRIRVNVDAAGKVSYAAFDSEGPSKYFANAALTAARKWRFKPAQTNGQPVPGAWTLKFQFTQAGAEVTPEAVR